MAFTIPNDFTNGSPVDAVPMKENFDAIEAALNNIGGEALATNSVGTDQLAPNAVITENILDDSVTSAKLASTTDLQAVTTDVIRDDAVTLAKRAQVGKVAFTGGDTAGTGDMQDGAEHFSNWTSDYESVNGEVLMVRGFIAATTGQATHETRRLEIAVEYAEAVKVSEGSWAAHSTPVRGFTSLVAVPGYNDYYKYDQLLIINTVAGNKYKFRAFSQVNCDPTVGQGYGMASHNVAIADIVVIG